MMRILLLALLAALAGCASTQPAPDSVVEAQQAPLPRVTVQSTELLVGDPMAARSLDVGLVTFDPGLPEDENRGRELGIFPEVRNAEASFLLDYMGEKITSTNPFHTLDTGGVGRLMKIATDDGRATNPTLQIGICGEHGGEPASIAFGHAIGLDYVSCSAPRVPVARLAAAHAALAPRSAA